MIDKLLYRQIHPNFVINNKATPQAFKPTKSNRCVSVYDGDMIDAKLAWKHYTKMIGLKSAGVMGVTNKECESKNLKVISDPKPSFKEHVLISFDDLSQSEIDRAARSLTTDANDRKWCYNPADDGLDGHPNE